MKKNEVAELQKLDIRTARIRIQGLSPLIMNRWSETAREDMLRKQMKKTVRKEAKDPEEQYEASIYRTDDDELCFPVDGMKKAMVRGAKQLNLVMKDMLGAFFVVGEFSQKQNRDVFRLNGTVEMREDMVRLGGTTSDIHYRGQVVGWSADIALEYNAAVVSFDQLVNMMSAAGWSVGLGDWRPERSGTFGRFTVAASAEKEAAA